MIEVTVDSSDVRALGKEFAANARRALVAAVKGESFRLRQLVQAKFQSGVSAATAQLTRKEQKAPTAAALSAFARFVGYEPEEQGDWVLGRIGFSRSITRARNAEGRKRQMVALFGGGRHPIERTDQLRMAYKLRKRLGEPVRSVMLGKGEARRLRRVGGKRKNPARHPWADLGAFLPKTKSSLGWPLRDWVSQVLRAEAANVPVNVAKLFDVALQGQRWSKQWWDASGRYK